MKNEQGKKVAIFGSAFNPTTLAHIKIMNKLSTNFDEVYAVASYSHPIKGKLIAFNDRINMLQLAVEQLGKKNLHVSTIEEEIAAERVSDTPIYTVEVLAAFSEVYKKEEIYFVVGDDNKDLHLFSDEDAKIIRNEYNLYVVDDIEGVRSTIVRDKVSKSEDLSGLTIDPIINYIQKNNLYKPGVQA